ncbi:MAG TPA: hypothetical protein VHM31_08280 [Polyangia bacterium]|nr:hypothetical protein [Polyangia bacterium]
MIDRFICSALLALVLFGATARAQGGEAPPPPEPPQNAPAEIPPAAQAPTPPPAVTAPVAVVPAAPAATWGAVSIGSAWFDRAPYSLSLGQGDQKWVLTFYGFVEADYIADTTRSYNDAIGSALVARSITYDGTVGRTQFTMRNTRVGLAFQSPAVGSTRPSAVIEGDFFGSQTPPPTGSENNYFDSPVFRIRHAYLKLESPAVDILAGQTYDVFGWQNYFFPMSAEFLGLPNMVFSRNTQFRLSRGFGAAAGPVTVDVAVEAGRPAQRDSQVPDFDAGVRLSLNNWKGITTPGNVRTVALPASIGVSGVVRQFKVNAFTPPPTQTSNNATGWGVSVDLLLPVIPVADVNDRGNALTLTGSAVIGTGIADLLTTGGGAQFPTLPNPMQASPPPPYAGNIDNGLVTFDVPGVLHTIDWRAFRGGLQYYLPPTGRLIFAANLTYAHSPNMKKLFPQGGAEIELLGAVADTSIYGDANLFWDATPAVRFGISGQYTKVQYLDGESPHNLRGMGQALYVF